MVKPSGKYFRFSPLRTLETADHTSQISASGNKNSSITCRFGTTNVCPSDIGNASRNAIAASVWNQIRSLGRLQNGQSVEAPVIFSLHKQNSQGATIAR